MHFLLQYICILCIISLHLITSQYYEDCFCCWLFKVILICFISICRLVSFLLVPFRFRLVLFHFDWFCFVSFRILNLCSAKIRIHIYEIGISLTYVWCLLLRVHKNIKHQRKFNRFRFVMFPFISIGFVSFDFISISFRTLPVPQTFNTFL
jgi:nitrate reductase NapE component